MWTESVDLHCHSWHSDGIFSPKEMAQRAHDSGVTVWSLTDHDTDTGWQEASAACEELGIRFIPGVEITCQVEIKARLTVQPLGIFWLISQMAHLRISVIGY